MDDIEENAVILITTVGQLQFVYFTDFSMVLLKTRFS
jgi:hypothetical protein